jgi:small subunit ribosomal protein S17
VAEEAPAEEAVAEETPAEEAVAEESPAEEVSEAPSPEREEDPAAEAPAQLAPQKPKRKRLPRAERRQRTKPKRVRPAERKAISRLAKPEHLRGKRKERRGIVVSAAMDKTIVVRVDTVKPHPVYKKIVRRSTKFHAHDEGNVAKAGDVVRIVETRPLSKTKNWRLAQVLEEAK